MANSSVTTSSKFGKTKKLIQFVPPQDSNPTGLYGDTDSGIQRIKGKRHFSTPTEPKHYNWKSSIKVPKVPTSTDRPAGIKKIPPVFTQSKTYTERKHVTPVRQSTVAETFNDKCEVKCSGAYVMNNRIW